MKHTGSGKKISKSKSSSTKQVRLAPLRLSTPGLQFVVCVKSGGNVDLEPLKVYKIRRDPTAQANRLLRVVDASGEDYLYPAEYFRPILAPRRLFEAVEK